MLDLDDILPTMLVCRQFFACKHLTILCKDLSGFILGNLKDYSLDDILPTMLVCKQFFFRKLVPRLIEFGPIVIDRNDFEANFTHHQLEIDLIYRIESYS